MTNKPNIDQMVKVNPWNSDEFVKRLKIAIKSDSPYAFAKKCGIGESVMRSYLSGATTPGTEKLLVMATVANVSLDWLVTGKQQPSPINHVKDQLADYSNSHDSHWAEFERIPLYSVEASAGHGSAIESEEIKSAIAFRKDWLSAKGFQADMLATLIARGDSMEPTIQDGSLLLVNCLEKEVTGDAIYIIRIDGHLYAKRLQQMFSGELYIKSDNPAYTTEIVIKEKVNDLKIVGRVIWVGRET